MEGFFSKAETKSKSRPDGKTLSCASCGLYKKCKSPKLKPTGDFAKGILNVVGIPGKVEDRQNKPFTGSYYKTLETFYKKAGIDLHKDCLNTYAIKCHTENVDNYNIQSCRKFMLKLIEERKPKVIVLFGYEALYSIVGYRWKKSLDITTDTEKHTNGKWQGLVIPDQELEAFVIPTFSLDFINNAERSVEELYFQKDINKVKEALARPYFSLEQPPIIEYLPENKLHILNTIDTEVAAFDYETTGIKPHAKGHRIICASIAYTEQNVYTFMMPKSKAGKKPFVNFLQREDIKKIAQNKKYEDTWSEVRLKTEVKNWWWDTMIATHIIDNRPGITGLKFQVYVQFGVPDYDEEISYYLRAAKEGDANAINRIMELIETEEGRKKLLTYCAYDSIYELRLYNLQKEIINKTQPIGSVFGSNIVDAYNLFHEGTLALAKAERQGLQIDTEYAEKKEKLLTKKITRIEKQFFESDFYKGWKKEMGKRPNLNSGKQLGIYLYDSLGHKPLKRTKTGQGSTDEEALSLLKIPELDLLLKRSKLLKVRDTYLKAFVREQVNGVLHPFFNLNIAQTYRSSSSNPNFQNIPKRDKEAMTIVRKAIKPRPGHQLLEVDYSGIEVGIATCYHKDSTMIKYITNGFDMHGDIAAQIFRIKDFDKHNKEHSTLRKAAKNTFVFPQFYGDYYRNNAIGMCGTWLHLPQTKWKGTEGIDFQGAPISKYLKSIGLKSFEDFVEHIKALESDFWTNRFPEYAAWKEDHYNTYLKYGYVPLKTGFVCQGLMSKNEVINYPVQGAAFHCLLWSFIEITKELEKRGMVSKIVGQIHDAIVFDVHPDELNEVWEIVQDIGTVKLKEAFPWIIVPLEIEAELCPVDASWDKKEDWNPNN